MLPQRLLYPVHASVCVQAAVELSKQLQQRIKQRGCREEFVPSVDMLEQGKVGGWMDEAFVCLLEGCGTCVAMLWAQGHRGGHGCFCCSAVCVVVRLSQLGKQTLPHAWHASLPQSHDGCFLQADIPLEAAQSVCLTSPIPMMIIFVQVEFLPAAALSAEELERQRLVAEEAAKATR